MPFPVELPRSFDRVSVADGTAGSLGIPNDHLAQNVRDVRATDAPIPPDPRIAATPSLTTDWCSAPRPCSDLVTFSGHASRMHATLGSLDLPSLRVDDAVLATVTPKEEGS